MISLGFDSHHPFFQISYHLGMFNIYHSSAWDQAWSQALDNMLTPLPLTVVDPIIIVSGREKMEAQMGEETFVKPLEKAEWGFRDLSIWVQSKKVSKCVFSHVAYSPIHLKKLGIYFPVGSESILDGGWMIIFQSSATSWYKLQMKFGSASLWLRDLYLYKEGKII